MKDHKFLYHITKRENLESILKHGIIPAHKRGLNLDPSTQTNEVWLTDNCKYILTVQAGLNWSLDHMPVILGIDCADIVIYPKIDYRFTSIHEYCTTEIIQPDKIVKVIKHTENYFEKIFGMYYEKEYKGYEFIFQNNFGINL